MAHYKIVSRDFEHIPSKSVYNYNYYRHRKTSDVILEILHEDEGCAEYHNFGKTPTFTNADFANGEFLGYTRSENDYIDSVAEFEIDTEWT